jgi:hypothetical protein
MNFRGAYICANCEVNINEAEEHQNAYDKATFFASTNP